MKKLATSIPLVFLCCLIVSCKQGEKATRESKADVQAIKDVVAGFNLAVNTGDIGKASQYHADDPVVIPPNRPALLGKNAHLSDLRHLFDQFAVQEVDVVDDVQVNGDLGVAHYTWSAVVTPKAGGKPIDERGKGIMVLKRQPEGVWKFTYLIWSNESLVFPKQAE